MDVSWNLGYRNVRDAILKNQDIDEMVPMMRIRGWRDNLIGYCDASGHAPDGEGDGHGDEIAEEENQPDEPNHEMVGKKTGEKGGRKTESSKNPLNVLRRLKSRVFDDGGVSHDETKVQRLVKENRRPTPDTGAPYATTTDRRGPFNTQEEETPGGGLYYAQSRESGVIGDGFESMPAGARGTMQRRQAIRNQATDGMHAAELAAVGSNRSR